MKLNEIISWLLKETNANKDLYPIVAFIPLLLGGAYQFFQISSISPSLLKFFSISQLLSDGINIFILLLILFAPLVLGKSFLSLLSKFDIRSKAKAELVSTVFVFSLFVLIISYFSDSVIFFSEINWNVFFSNSFSSWSDFFKAYYLSLLTLLFVVIMLAGVRDVVFIQLRKSKKITAYLKLKKEIIRKVFNLAYYIFIFPIILLFLSIVIFYFSKVLLLESEYRNPKNLLNIENLEKKQKILYPKRKISIKYYNDKYAFFVVDDDILVRKIDDLIDAQ